MDGTPVLYIENQTFDELSVGQSASLSHIVTQRDIELFAVATGDVNPAHLDDAFARDAIFHKIVAHGMWGGALISAVLGTHLPGPGAIYTRQMLNFRAPVRIGETVRAVVEIMGLNPLSKKATLKTTCMVKEDVVIDGQACVLVPSRA